MAGPLEASARSGAASAQPGVELPGDAEIQIGDVVHHATLGTGCVAGFDSAGRTIGRFDTGLKRFECRDVTVALAASDRRSIESRLAGLTNFAARGIRHGLVFRLTLADVRLAAQATEYFALIDDIDTLLLVRRLLGGWAPEVRTQVRSNLTRVRAKRGLGPWDALEADLDRRAAAEMARQRQEAALAAVRAAARADAERALEDLRRRWRVLQKELREIEAAWVEAHRAVDASRSEHDPARDQDPEALLTLASDLLATALDVSVGDDGGLPHAVGAEALAACTAVVEQLQPWMHDDRRRREARTHTERINAVRAKRGEPALDAREREQVFAILQARAEDPNRYRNVCWSCHTPVDEAVNEHCLFCRWLVCWCAACRSPEWGGDGHVGPCRSEAWAFEEELGYPDMDYRGEPILTATQPAPDAREIRRTLEQRRVTRLLHWTPARNAASIIEHGILARSELLARGVKFVPHGYGSAAKESLLGDYVALSFAQKDDMMAAWSEAPVVFGVAPEAATSAGTLFIPGNSASRTFTPSLESWGGGPALTSVFETLTGRPVPQAEVWVPRRVPRIAITEVFVPSDDIRERVLAAFADTRRDPIPSVEVRSRLAALCQPLAHPDRKGA